MKKNRAMSRTVFLALLMASIGSLGWPSAAHAQFSARLFTTAANAIIQIGPSGPANWCVQAEPIGNGYQATDVDANTVVLISPGTGSVSQISISNKTILVGDTDGNGVPEARYCFAKGDLQALFSDFHGNKLRTVTLTLQGNLIQGGTVSGQITIQVDPH